MRIEILFSSENKMSCDLDNPCDSDQVCNLEDGECRDWEIPAQKNLIQIKIGDTYFEGKKFLVNFHLTRMLSNLLDEPCTLGPFGLNARGRLISSFGEDTVGILDLETGEILCITGEELEAIYQTRKIRAIKYLEDEEPDLDEPKKEVFNLLYWDDKYLPFGDIRHLKHSEKHFLAIAPTQYLVKVGRKSYRLYHGVPVGELREEAKVVPRPSYPPTFIPEFEEIVREFRGPQLLQFNMVEFMSDVAINMDGTLFAVVLDYRNFGSLIQVWSIREQKEVARRQVDGDEFELAFSPVDAGVLAFASYSEVGVWEIHSDSYHKISDVAFSSLAFTSNGNMLYYLASPNGIVGYDIARSQGVTIIITGDIDISQIEISPDNQVLVGLGDNDHLLFYDLNVYNEAENATLIETVDIPEIRGNIDDFKFNPNSDMLILTGNQEPPRIYYRYSGERRVLPVPYESQHKDTKSGCFNADGSLAIALYGIFVEEDDSVIRYLHITVFDQLRRYLSTIGNIAEMRENFELFREDLQNHLPLEIVTMINEQYRDDGLEEMYDDYVTEHYEEGRPDEITDEDREFMRTRGDEIRELIVNQQRQGTDGDGWFYYICVWDTQDWELVQTIPVPPTIGLTPDPVDPHWLASNHEDHTVRFWEI